MSIQFPCPFLIGLFFLYWIIRVSYIFWILTPYQIWFAHIFPHSVGCPFILFVVSFVMPKLLSLIRSQLFIFVFTAIILRGGSKKVLLPFMSERVLPIFPYKSFIISGLTFKFWIHFEFIFVYDVREYSNSIILHVAAQFSQHNLLKKLSFLHYIFLPPFS